MGGVCLVLLCPDQERPRIGVVQETPTADLTKKILFVTIRHKLLCSYGLSWQVDIRCGWLIMVLFCMVTVLEGKQSSLLFSSWLCFFLFFNRCFFVCFFCAALSCPSYLLRLCPSFPLLLYPSFLHKSIYMSLVQVTDCTLCRLIRKDRSGSLDAQVVLLPDSP